MKDQHQKIRKERVLALAGVINTQGKGNIVLTRIEWALALADTFGKEEDKRGWLTGGKIFRKYWLNCSRVDKSLVTNCLEGKIV